MMNQIRGKKCSRIIRDRATRIEPRRSAISCAAATIRGMIFALLSLLATFNISECTDGLIWSSENGSFVPLYSVPTFSRARKERLDKLREIEYHNFQNEPLSVAYFQEVNLVNFIENDTKISGVCGEVWNMLADYLNFTLVPIKVEDRNFGVQLENGSYDGILGLLQRNQSQIIPRSGLFSNRMSLVEYTLPMWKIRYHLYIKPEWDHDGAWMLHLFSRDVWCLYYTLLTLLGTAGYIYEKNSQKIRKDNDNKAYSLEDYLFYTLAIASSQGSVPTEMQYKSRLTYISTSVLSWLILIAFNSHAIFLMMNKKSVLPFTDLKSLIQTTDYSVIAFSGSMVHGPFKEQISKYYKYQRDRYRVSYATGAEEMFTKVCFSKKRKFAAFEAEDRHRAVGKYICQLLPTKTSYFTTWIASAIKRGFLYKRSFDIGILKMSETGLIDGLRDRWLNWKFADVEDPPFQSIGMNQVKLIFFLLAIGFSASIFVLAAELLTFCSKKKFTTNEKKVNNMPIVVRPCEKIYRTQNLYVR